MTEEVDYEALPSNAGLTVRLSSSMHEKHLTHPCHTTQVNMLAGGMVSYAHGPLCFMHAGHELAAKKQQ